MYEDLVEHLRECAKYDKAENTFKSAADAIDDLLYICKHQATEIEELRKAVLRLEDESGIYDELPMVYIYPTKWIPVTERLPEEGKKVLVFAYGHDVLTARLCKKFEFDYPVFDCNGIYNELAKQGRITHWMPLPEPPKEE